MNKIILLSIIFLGLIAPVFFVFAGTIDPNNLGYKYAWSDKGGWINFGCTNCNVQVTDSGLTGYAWSQNYGWISLSCSNNSGSCSPSWGVTNTTGGDLSGNAWGQNTGWIDFSGANINCSGKFTGSATNSVVGTINFDCANCNVRTNWQPSSGCGGGGSHNECNAQHQCVQIGTSGISTCSVDSDCVIACTANADCGTDGSTGSPFCQDGNVYQNYTAYTCSNPGTALSVCSSSSAANLTVTCASGTVCYNGGCQTVACSSNSGCGTDGYVDSPFCQNGNVYQNYTAYTCSNPGAADSSCLSSTTAQLKTSCSADEICDDGVCVLQQHNECSGLQCVLVSGSGLDRCQKNEDCTITHNECENDHCRIVNGPGIDQCQQNKDCGVGRHNECNSQGQCVVENGEGTDQCLTNSDCGGGGGMAAVNHNECNEQKQCISMPGEGSNQCQTDNDCGTVQQIINTVITQPVQAITTATQTAVVETKKIIETPAGSATTKTISTVGVVVTTAATASSFLTFSFLEIFSIPFRLLGLLLTALGIKKRAKPWGVAYDSVTKRPLDPVYIVLKDMQGRDISTAITDIDGRYGFLVPTGIYRIAAHKTNYVFPSKKLSGKTSDELHSDLYFGESIEVKETGKVIIKNIPLDPMKFDWNEFAKKSKRLMKFYSKWDVVLRKFYDIMFVVGFIVAIIAFAFAPYPYNAIIAGLYLFLLLLRILGLRPKTYGYILDKTTGDPLSFAIVRVVMPGEAGQPDRVISSKSADKYGRYYCLVPSGKYYVKIEKKNPDGSYSLVHTSGIINVLRKGIIKEKFKT